jgi:mannose-6-phosphate isomerase-like protein (cupin superfamily)
MAAKRKGRAMRPVKSGERIVLNASRAPYKSFDLEGAPCPGVSYLPIDDKRPPGTGLYIFKMEPGAISTAHEHTSDEMFYVLDGELIENDGTVYRPGDMVLLKAGTQHSSHTHDGCTLLVYVETLEIPLG